MTMHLAHPALTTMGKRKGKQKWASAEQKRQHEQLEREWQELLKRQGADLEAQKQKRALKAKPYVGNVNPRIAELRKIASVDSGHKGAVTIKQTPQYTGDKIIGIGTMHKSNAVPIFNDEAAKDISKMRR
jgi:hypothetical protein